jgi:hypothetical protein
MPARTRTRLSWRQWQVMPTSRMRKPASRARYNSSTSASARFADALCARRFARADNHLRPVLPVGRVEKPRKIVPGHREIGVGHQHPLAVCGDETLRTLAMNPPMAASSLYAGTTIDRNGRWDTMFAMVHSSLRAHARPEQR